MPDLPEGVEVEHCSVKTVKREWEEVRPGVDLEVRDGREGEVGRDSGELDRYRRIEVP